MELHCCYITYLLTNSLSDKHFLYMRNDEKYRKNHQKSGGYFKFILSVETSYDIVLFVWYKDNVRLEDPDSRLTPFEPSTLVHLYYTFTM